MRMQKRGIMVIGIIAILSLFFLAGLDNLFKHWNGYSWNQETIENFLGTSLPVDTNYMTFEGHRGRGGELDLILEASHESVESFVSNFCGNTLYQGYDPFNALDTTEQHQGAYRIKMDQVSYYSYSPNTSDNLFGMRCYSGDKGQVQILVDKTSNDIALLKMEILFTCYKCSV